MFISNWDVIYATPGTPNKKTTTNGSSVFDNQKHSAFRKDQFPPISAIPFMVASMEASVKKPPWEFQSQMLNVWYIYLHLYLQNYPVL